MGTEHKQVIQEQKQTTNMPLPVSVFAGTECKNTGYSPRSLKDRPL